jgi:hypothetical protein
MNFHLEKTSGTKALVKFNIVNDAKELCGSVSVTPGQEADLLKHWRAAATPPARPTADKMAKALLAQKRTPRTPAELRQAALRGS